MNAVPQTAGAVLAFLGLVAPGLLFELLRERRRPTFNESAFHEAGRVALMSLAFTLLAFAILAAVRIAAPGAMPDPGKWLQQGNAYVKAHYLLVAGALLAEVIVACAAVLVADLVIRGSARGHIRHRSIWFQVLRIDRPAHKVPWLGLTLDDGTEISGYLAYYTEKEEQSNREIALWGPCLGIRPPRHPEYTELDKWKCIVIRGDKISHMKVTYLDEEEPANPKPLARRLRMRRLSSVASPAVSGGNGLSADPALLGTQERPERSGQRS